MVTNREYHANVLFLFKAPQRCWIHFQFMSKSSKIWTKAEQVELTLSLPASMLAYATSPSWPAYYEGGEQNCARLQLNFSWRAHLHKSHCHLLALPMDPFLPHHLATSLPLLVFSRMLCTLGCFDILQCHMSSTENIY